MTADIVCGKQSVDLIKDDYKANVMIPIWQQKQKMWSLHISTSLDQCSIQTVPRMYSRRHTSNLPYKTKMSGFSHSSRCLTRDEIIKRHHPCQLHNLPRLQILLRAALSRWTFQCGVIHSRLETQGKRSFSLNDKSRTLYYYNLLPCWNFLIHSHGVLYGKKKYWVRLKKNEISLNWYWKCTILQYT